MKTNTSSSSSASKEVKKENASRGSAASKSESLSELQELFVDSLKDIYWAEKALTNALPKMVKNCTTAELKSAIEDHLAVTEEHVTRLEGVFESIGVKATAKKCEAMAGLIKEAEEIMESATKGVVRDAAIILASQKVEHYEIATYGTLRSFANTLGHTEAAELLDQTLREEKEADSNLTAIAESSINFEAAGEV